MQGAIELKLIGKNKNFRYSSGEMQKSTLEVILFWSERCSYQVFLSEALFPWIFFGIFYLGFVYFFILFLYCFLQG